MAGRGGFELRVDQAGIAEVLKSDEVGAVIDALGQTIAANVRAQHPEAEVNVRSYTFDRRAVSIAFVHPRSHDLQLRDGVLTKAAAAAGLEVKEVTA